MVKVLLEKNHSLPNLTCYAGICVLCLDVCDTGKSDIIN